MPHELVTGVHQTGHDSAIDQLDTAIDGSHMPVLELAPRLPPRLAYAIERAFAPRPTARFGSMQALADTLTADAEVASRDELAALVRDLFGPLVEREREALARVVAVRATELEGAPGRGAGEAA